MGGRKAASSPSSFIETKLKGFGPAGLDNPAPSRRFCFVLLCFFCSSWCSLRGSEGEQGDLTVPLPADGEAAAPSFQLSNFVPPACHHACCIAGRAEQLGEGAGHWVQQGGQAKEQPQEPAPNALCSPQHLSGSRGWVFFPVPC